MKKTAASPIRVFLGLRASDFFRHSCLIRHSAFVISSPAALFQLLDRLDKRFNDAMLKHLEGGLAAADDSFAIVVSRYNEMVTRRLLDGAMGTFRHHGVADERVTVAWVPGSFEIPVVADRLAHSGQFAAVCCLGAVVQGQTSHHEYINQQVSRAIMETAVSSGVPVLFGVLTCPSMELALERAGGTAGNKGSETALAAIEMANLLKKLPQVGTRTVPRGV